MFYVAIACFLLPAWFAAGAVNGDFNGDGRLDMLVVSQCSPIPCSNSTITVTLGRGDGRFRGTIQTLTEGFPGGDLVVVGRFNNDPALDIAFLSWTAQPMLAVVLGNGNGSFGSTTLYPLNLSVHGLLGGDVNGDGKLDLLVSNEMPGVFLGNGDGTFSTLPDVPGVGGCVLADANHDGKLDAIGTGISFGNGDGTFRAAQDITGPGNCPTVGDLNGDGNLDVAALVRGGIKLYVGNSDGSFQSPVYKWLFPGTPARLRTADFNGDGLPDLIATRNAQVDILLNRGGAQFRPAVGYLRTSDTLGDFNSDGRTDVIIGSGSLSPIAALAAPNGTLPLPRSYWVQGYGNALLSGDLNGDGKLDLIEGVAHIGSWNGGQVNRLIGDGDGTFKVQQSLVRTGGKNSGLQVAADLNADGKLDVLVSSNDSVNILLGLGDVKFQTPRNYPIQGPSQLAVADFNGDGVLDIFVNGIRFQRAGMLLLGNGDGTFRNGPVLSGQFDRVVVGDFNNDGKQDLAVAPYVAAWNFSGQVGIMLGNGDGTFKPISDLRKGYFGSLLAADFNSDGNLDVAGVGANSSGAVIASVYLGTGMGTLQVATNTWIKGGIYRAGGAVTADFNGDKKLDLAVSLYSGETAIMFGNGMGGFSSRSLYLGGGAALVAGDFDENGTQDVAVLTAEDSVAVLLRQP
jgi:hypothetical protein